MKGKFSLQDAREIIEKAFQKDIEITSFRPMKSGMTNDSYIFKVNQEEFILRMPGKGSEELINREHEYEVYQLIRDKDLSDELVFFDPVSGVKITRYIPTARVCDPRNYSDLEKIVTVLKKFHDMKLEVEHFFDPWERLLYYESLWGKNKSKYDDYNILKSKIREIYLWTLNQPREIVLSHIDSVADNFLIDQSGKTYLIDWEYSAMQDKDIDIAMFAIYSLLNKKEIDELINLYQNGDNNHLQKRKIYAYIAIMGLVWSNWCEFQNMQGQDLGEYAYGQHQYAKDFSVYFDNFDLKGNS